MIAGLSKQISHNTQQATQFTEFNNGIKNEFSLLSCPRIIFSTCASDLPYLLRSSCFPTTIHPTRGNSYSSIKELQAIKKRTLVLQNEQSLSLIYHCTTLATIAPFCCSCQSIFFLQNRMQNSFVSKKRLQKSVGGNPNLFI